jgi:hypothetical protein
MEHAWEKIHTKFHLKNLKRKEHLAVLRVDGRMTLKWILKHCAWTGFIWLGIGTIVVFLWT